MSKKNLIQISKFLSLVLRHKPNTIGLKLNSEGWASISKLIEGARSHIPLTKELIEQVVSTNDKQRFKISDDGLMIRASQGHSVNVDLKLSPQKPPALLYHGTATRFLESIRNEGLNPGNRHYVHLSEDEKTAKTVGQRYGKPAVLKIEARQMYQQGFTFFLAENGVWLIGQVPPEFLSSSNIADSAITSKQPKLST